MKFTKLSSCHFSDIILILYLFSSIFQNVEKSYNMFKVRNTHGNDFMFRDIRYPEIVFIND